MTPIKKTFQYGQHAVTLETGEIARQASGAVIVNMADTVVLVTMVAAREDAGRDFLPMRVDYQERTYAAGRIPGGFFRRHLLQLALQRAANINHVNPGNKRYPHGDRLAAIGMVDAGGRFAQPAR